jgi:hypothetical protein
MRLRHLLVPLVVSATAVVAVQATASAHDGHNEQRSWEQHDGQRHDGQRHDSSPLTEQNFTITSDFSRDSGGPVVASGAINATGQDVVIGETEDNFVFPGGTLTVFHAPVRSKDFFNEQKCTGGFRESGRYVISSATGQYAGINGSGEYQAAGSFTNGCEGQTPTGTITITAQGSINLPSS